MSSVHGGLFIAGLVFLLTGIVGGGIEVQQLRVPRIGTVPRCLTGMVGVAFLLVSILGVLPDRPFNSDAPSTPSAPSAPTPQPALTPQQLAVRTTPTSDVASKHRAGIMAAIQYANNAEIEAFRSLDPRPLRAAYVGERLNETVDDLQSVKQLNLYVVNKLENQQFQSFQVSPDESSAEVEVTETWSATAYDVRTQRCTGRMPRHQLPQTVFLQHTGSAWVINSIQFHASSPDFGPC